MIKELHIDNYALIDRLDIEFGPTLNIITGETGAGKSIILGALALLMGARAETRAIRDSSRKTVVEARFDVTRVDMLNTLLEQYDVDILGDGTECILRRELTVRGGSRAFVNDTPVTVAQLREVAGLLVDIHSQHQNRLLADSGYQLALLDALAGNRDLLTEYKSLYQSYRHQLEQYTRTRDMLTRNQAESEYLRFQLEQLDSLDLKEGEQHELEQQRDLAVNLAHIKGSVNSALTSLSGSTDVSGSLAHASEALSQLAEHYDRADELTARLESARLEIQDIVETVEQFDATLGSETADLDAIDERLGRIYSLESRHHVDTDSELIALREKLRKQLETINNAEPVMEELAGKARQAKKEAVLKARVLTERRQQCARKLAAELEERARPLALPNLRCEISVAQGKLTATGLDTVELKLAFNKNQTPTAVGNSASGGEISRIVLALKSIAVQSMNMPTIIFDEVDTGVSGDTANRMARMMYNLAQGQQVIVITHLPQVAAAAEYHFKVSKHDDETGTTSVITRLSNNESLAELALMLAGDANAQGALTTARTLKEAYAK